MTTEAQSTPRRALNDRWLVFAIWLFVSAAMIWLSRSNIALRDFPDPDDSMRLLQVRDWLAGQSWFDVTQYRLNPPTGVHMHWSRLVDVPLAAVILLVRPLLGQTAAETAALVVVPLATLLIAMLLMHRISSRLMDSRSGPLLAVLALSVSLGTLQQMRPMRIDHHGWQIVAALTTILAVLDDRPVRSGIIAGIAMALCMNISIEGLPFAAAVGAWLALQWLLRGSANVRLKAYIVALAATSVLVFGLTHYPSTWLHQPHDVITIAHLTGFSVTALGCLAAAGSDVVELSHRLVRLAAVGAAAIAAMFLVDPHWMQGPFDSLDPLVRDMWYLRVDEGLPIWRLEPSQIGVALAQPIVGLVGALLAIRTSSGIIRERWIAYAFLLCASTLASVFVVRAATTGSLIGLPGTAYLCIFALKRARSVSMMPARVLATSASLCIIAPAYAVPVSVTTVDKRVERAVKSMNDCFGQREVGKLSALPTGTFAAPLDITPDILVETPHSGIASGHHRGSEAMRDVIRLFVFTPDIGHQIVAQRHVDYVFICPGAPETVRYAYHGPNGLAALLAANRPPAWLQPIRIPGLRAIRAWRVRKI